MKKQLKLMGLSKESWSLAKELWNYGSAAQLHCGRVSRKNENALLPLHLSVFTIFFCVLSGVIRAYEWIVSHENKQAWEKLAYPALYLHTYVVCTYWVRKKSVPSMGM